MLRQPGEGGTTNAEAHAPAATSMFGPDWRRLCRKFTFQLANAPLFKVMYEYQSADEEKQHHTVENPSLSRLAYHPAEGIGEGCRQEHDRQHFEKVCKWRGILIRMGSIRVKETPPFVPRFMMISGTLLDYPL